MISWYFLIVYTKCMEVPNETVMLKVCPKANGCTIAGRWTRDNIRIDNGQPPLMLEVHQNLMDVL